VVDSISTSQPVVLTPVAIKALPVERLGSITGVSHRVLWRTEDSVAGVLTVDGGHRLGTHAHRLNHHHLWVVDGRATILDVEVDPGSCVHIPGGVDHDIDASATDGCTVFYLYLRPGS
jgi:hypothetical protein